MKEGTGRTVRPLGVSGCPVGDFEHEISDLRTGQFESVRSVSGRGRIAAGWAGASWQPLTHPPRRLMVECVSCGHAAVNESNRLHRANWQETVSTPRSYRCSACAIADSTPEGDAP